MGVWWFFVLVGWGVGLRGFRSFRFGGFDVGCLVVLVRFGYFGVGYFGVLGFLRLRDWCNIDSWRFAVVWAVGV